MEFSTHFFLMAAPLILIGLAEQTRQLRERLQVSEQVQAAKSAFFARVSHELRSPLNTILGYSRMLGRNSAKLSLAEGTRGIDSSALRLLRQIDELLDEARAEAGQLRISPGPLALRPWLDEIAQSARIVVEAQGSRLECRFLGDLDIDIEADGERLRQVLDNLLANANRHTRDGTLRLTCRAQAKAGEATLDFAVEDDGEGMAAEVLQRIFEPFVRGREGGGERGFGLGLPICRELLRQMGGEISAVSTSGQGSLFAFSLRVPVIGYSSHAASRQRLAGPPDTHSPRVLLVDDDAFQLGLLAELCEDAGFAVETASGGAAALARLREGEWSIVVTDQMMPDVDGWSVLREAHALQPGMPVVLLSSAAPCPPDNFPADVRFDAALLTPASSEDILATLWGLFIKVDTGETAREWSDLARLASEGGVSAIEEWIASERAGSKGCDRALVWVEGLLNRLELSLLERVAAKLASPPSAGQARG
ncbi:MAG: response regulator [Alphaproteobacteria bacterium]|nr:response regulator [Alphaproteobacteria bacterium]